MVILRTILFTAATAIVSFAFVWNTTAHVLAKLHQRKHRKALAYMTARRLVDQSISQESSSLQEKAEWLTERIGRPTGPRHRHAAPISGEEIDLVIKDCETFINRLRWAIRKEHRKFKRLPPDYRCQLFYESHDAWHEVEKAVLVIKYAFMDLRITGKWK